MTQKKVAKSKYPKIENTILKNLKDNEFVRMTGSGSAVIAYFKLKMPHLMRLNIKKI